MTVAITGAGGFIGKRLQQRLSDSGHTPRPVPRSSSVSELDEIFASADAVVHLAGEPVAQRWTDEAKQRIHDSRVQGTRDLMQALSRQSQPPGVLVCASAVGYYGSRGDQILTETSGPGTDFLARVVVDWEQAAHSAESLGIRVACLRLGMVLGPGGGALARLLKPFRLGFGGKLSSGRQWMPWIHLDDAVNLILFALSYSAIRGAVNLTAPHPVTNQEFTDRLATALHRPAILPVPGFALKLVFGEMAEMLLASQRVLPTVAKSAGFRFQYPDLHTALTNILD